MSKFNTSTAQPSATSVLTTEARPSGINANGGHGYVRDQKTELFLLGLSNFVGEEDFHESGLERDDRYLQLVAGVGLSDPDWLSRFLPWLRDTMNMRTAPLVGAAEFVRARQLAGVRDEPGRGRGVGRRTVDAVLQRPDEPGEVMAYWLDRYGKAMPMAFKHGVADAAARLYNGRTALSYDGENKAVRLGDVIELTHPKAEGWRNDVLRYLIDRRHGRDNPRFGDVQVLRARAELMALPVDQRRAVVAAADAPERLRAAAMTWKSLAGWLQGPMDATAWAAILPSMGYMAKLRNLRNFDAKDLPDELAEQVAAELCDPEQVARSRQLPMRFLSAYRAVQSDRWSWALDRALEISLAQITRLGGRTLVLVDTSGSMSAALSRRSDLKRWDAAVIFGLAVARRCEHADVVSFSNGYWGTPGHRRFDLRAGESLLRAIRRWETDGYNINGGTDTVDALRCGYKAHDRVVIITDEQAQRDGHLVTSMVPPHIPLYTWNLAGYRYGHAPSGGHNRFVFGGLSDAAFSVVPILEQRKHAPWPF